LPGSKSIKKMIVLTAAIIMSFGITTTFAKNTLKCPTQEQLAQLKTLGKVSRFVVFRPHILSRKQCAWAVVGAPTKKTAKEVLKSAHLHIQTSTKRGTLCVNEDGSVVVLTSSPVLDVCVPFKQQQAIKLAEENSRL